MKKIIAMILIACSVYANSIDEGKGLMNEAKYVEAGDFFMDLYLKDNVESNSYLGELYAYRFNDIADHCNVAAYFLFQGLAEGDCRSALIISNMYKDSICKKESNLESKYKEKEDKYMGIYRKCLTNKGEK